MASPEVHHLFHNPIADHSFSSDKRILAVARDNNVELYQKTGSKFSLTDELKGHEKTVTSVDIAPNSGRIVTCSQDRNAYVWEQTPAGWKPTLVLLRINRAATFVRWSPSEQKFAVGSGARVIAVCYFEEENDWWISKHLKKPIRSTITTLAWHPNSVLLAAGSTDSHARVFSSFIKGVDTRPEPSAWGERLPFNTICGEFLNDAAGWIHGVCFSPSGNALAFTGHDSSVTVVYPSAPEQPPRAMLNISTRLLPFNSLIWNGENEIIAAGHDCEPYRLRGDETGWQLEGSIESKAGPGAGSVREESALNMFRQMDLKGQAQADTKLETVHQNTISTIRVYEDAGGATVKCSVTDHRQEQVSMYSIFIFGLFTILTQLCRISTAHAVPLDFIRASEGSRKERRISPELFELLEELARIVDISYCVGATGVHKPFQCLSHCNELKDFELITTWHTGPLLADSCGYIALSHPPSPKRIIVAFRGTYSIANAIIDLSAYPQEYISYPAGNGTDNDDGGVQPKCNDCYVHAGFMAAWQSTRSKVLEAISAARDQYPDYELELVGHSLGGAVAALAGTEMQLRGWDPRITTFGEPRVGNKAFVDYLDKLFRLDFDDMHVWGFRRVTHVNDPVPLVPLTEWGYEMHAGEIYISRVGLPFSVEDVMYCRGGHDEKCISGAETALSLLRPSHEAYPEGPTAQQVLSSSSPNKQDSVISESWAKSRLPWHLVPPRFRLWELFYSHRDYFLRLGLCVPGGDPSGKW
ncbi:Alpha/Beta hydrolase protein [Aspergillus egyptiacus]|nr:Alpha/Beta hydrolase protein [Aspergillus egyptiacus]